MGSRGPSYRDPQSRVCATAVSHPPQAWRHSGFSLPWLGNYSQIFREPGGARKVTPGLKGKEPGHRVAFGGSSPSTWEFPATTADW